MEKKQALDPIKQLANSVDMRTVNKLLQETDLHDFEMTKQTITNIAEWCLNGESDEEIKKRLSLNKYQWGILLTCCPTLLIVMQETRSLAEVLIAGSLYQTAIGGKIIKKQQLARKHIYNDDGKVIGEEIVKEWVEEELPPNPLLLKYLAEKKLNEKLGKDTAEEQKDFKNVVNNMTKEDLALLEAMKKNGENLNGE